LAESHDFDEVFETHARFVWRALARLGVATSDIADASQEVFVVIHRQLPGFEGRSSLKTWLYEICVRVAGSFRNRAFRRHEQAVEAPVISYEARQDDELDWRRARAFLMAVLDQLDQEKREVFVLYDIEGLSMPEVAGVLRCPVTTAYSRLEVARRAVRAAFARRTLTERSA
jgi:RNA polymerase sigma-70 factor (ECF subfamily)